MFDRLNDQWRPEIKSSPKGMILIEVVVGIMLLGTLLTTILIAVSRLEIQRKSILKRSQSIEILDGLVDKFFRRGFPGHGMEQSISEDEALRWKVTVTPSPIIPQSLSIVRVTMLENKLNAGRELSIHSIAYVELVVENEFIGTFKP